MTYDIWERLGNSLQSDTYSDQYFTSEEYKESNNPLEILVVPTGVESFFGPRVLNLVIVSKPYGWERPDGIWRDFWPPAGLVDSIARHKEVFAQFTSYRTVFFMDFNLAKKMDAESEGESRLQEMLTAVKEHLRGVCIELAEYGFEMGPDIQNEVGAEFFAPYLDEHFHPE